MSLKYVKTHEDKGREKDDLRRSPIMRYLKNRDLFKFKVGDVLIKQNRWSMSGEWKVAKTSVGAPKKYMYVFENELGIGYIKQLKVDGSGFTSTLECTANLDPETTQLILDPEFVDHMLIGDDEFQYNKEHLAKKNFRQEAIAKNRKLLVRTRAAKKLTAWLHALKPGDKFWMGSTWDELGKNCWEVLSVNERVIELRVKNCKSGYTDVLTHNAIKWNKISMVEPYPLTDPLCGPQK